MLKIQSEKRKNRRQYQFLIEGYVRKMHSGGMLPAHFNLSEARSFEITDYEEYGKNWAYFEEWAQRERCLLLRKKIWKRVVESGSIIGLLLGANELYKIFASSIKT